MIFETHQIEIEDEKFGAKLMIVAKLSGWAGYVDFNQKAWNQAVPTEGTSTYRAPIIRKPWTVKCFSVFADGAAAEVLERYHALVNAHKLLEAERESPKAIFELEELL